MSGDQKKPRTFYLDGRETAQPIGIVTVYASARWNGPRLEIRYKVQQNRELRYEFSRTSNPDRLTVDVRFIVARRGGRKEPPRHRGHRSAPTKII